MAKILRKHIINTVKTNYYKHFLLLAFCWAAALFCVAIIKNTYGVSLVFLIALLFLSHKLTHKLRSLKSGADGEKSCLKLLSRLPKGYFVIPDVTIYVANKTAQIDYIVISPSGVFIIEAKNHGGIIRGNLSERYLYKTKHRNSKPFTSEFYNPAYQVSTHIKLMRQLLLKNNIDAEVFGAVYFTNPRTVLELSYTNCEIPVFSHKQNGEKLLLSLILQANKRLSKQNVARLKKLIFSSCK